MTSAFKPGARLGAYQIVAPIGAGGMGEVWQARDTRLGRDVALKFLPETLAADPERVARFRREAKLLASLNHPNIAAIHGLEEAEGKLLLDLELVPGEDLAVRLTRGRIPVDEALEIARQIVDALEAAHAENIVHRDLKPGNVKLTPDGKVKVLDFGLAKAYAADGVTSGSAADVSQSPTLARSGTLAGLILGTAAYMAPEQASGKALDRRPPAIVRLLRRCLRKRPRERLQDIGDARLELADAQAAAPESSGSSMGAAGAAELARRRNRERWAWAGMFASLAFAALVGSLARLRGTPEPPLPLHFVLDMPEGVAYEPTSPNDVPVVSPDGRNVVFAAVGPGTSPSRLFVRSLESGKTRALPGTEGGGAPFWSPDSASVGFFAIDALQRIDLAAGTVRRICSVAAGPSGGGTWNNEGTILFQLGGPGTGRLNQVSVAGGEPVPLTTHDKTRKETFHKAPQFLSDGRRFLFGVSSEQSENAGLLQSSLDAPGERRRVSPDSGRALVTPGHLLIARDGSVFAQPFDSERLALTTSDGRWLTYVSNDSGQSEVYVQPFRRSGERVRVSVDGGGQPKWRRDGKELFYLSRDGRVMAVATKAGAEAIEVGLPTELFDTGSYRPDYDDYAPSADGQRFLVKVPLNKRGAQIHVLLNWPSLLKGK